MNNTPKALDEKRFKYKLEQLIDANLTSGELDNTFLARKMYLSESTFYRSVRQYYELSANGLIRKIRLNRARQLLLDGRVTTVRDAAMSVGFSHVGYFIRRFEDQFGEKPTAVKAV